MSRPTRYFWAASLLTAACFGQPTVAPTSEPVGPVRGENWSDYNVVDSFETGYRFRTFGGSLDQYRSTVNYGDGVRLLSSFFTINSKDGHGKYFDEIVLTTQGLGNDPYENATLRIQKNRLYRYDLNWRLNDYFNPGLRTGGQSGQHLLDTEYTTQDQDLTLFPQSNIQFFLGYSRGDQNGPAISTIQLFNSRGNEFPLFENVRRVRNEYRIGNQIRLFGVRFTWTRGWEDFREDSNYLSGPNAGNIPGNPTTLSSFQRAEPFHGTSPYWRGGLFAERKRFSVNGRLTYTSGERAFVLDETALGTVRLTPDARQVLTAGNAQRPVFAGNLTFSFFPTSKLTVTNQTTVNNIRIDGNSAYAEYDNATQAFSYTDFEFLGIRTVANETDLNLQATRWLGLFGGYQYSDRQIRSTEYSNTSGNIFLAPSEQTNLLHEGQFGIRLKPAKGLNILLDSAIGRANRPLTPIADRNYQVLGGRVQYRLKTLQFSASSRENYNTNSVLLSAYASHARTHSVDASWTPRDWFALDAGYSKLHLNTAGGIAYFASGQFIAGQPSIYVSNLHVGTLTARFDWKKKADFFVGYSHTQDTGDGRDTALLTQLGPALAPFQAAQTFPLRFLSPMARLSIRIREKIRWNIGYQYYGYNERFLNGEDYRAHTGYSSVLWSF
ncbi:MAG TPA: hypothetical protein VEV17_25200 [Bryobacteraceae bacterium]|nr:hypothetical protein [Bryobacteraceae bacterium]